MILVQAHRGASAVAPENTLSAFKKAISLGSNGIECDIHLTKDKKIVVCHDETIDRTSNGSGKISDLTYSQLLKYDFGEKFNTDFKGERIPLLTEMLEVVKDMQVINIEIKSFGENPNTAIDDFYNILKQYKVLDRLIISSFNAPLLKAVRQRHSNLVTAYLYASPNGNDISYAKENLCTYIHPCIDYLTQKSVDEARKQSLGINAWTANTKEAINKCILFDLGIITNYPDIAMEMVERTII